VTPRTDGGGKGPAYSTEPVYGRDNVAAALLAITANHLYDMSIRYRTVYGDPCALVFSGESPFAAVVFDLSPDGRRIGRIYSVTNFDKISGVR
jgi:RNA polymerase sigma-70 factor (ECF subfamily)